MAPEIKIMEFTGLYDCTKWDDLSEEEKQKWINDIQDPGDWKGREIFTGNILEYKGIRGVVVFDNGSFTLDNPLKMGMVYITRNDIKHPFNVFKVIGNIYANPELTTIL